ncbi:MAG: ribulokinase, partial [Planctomycetota bacterium]
MSTRKLTLGLDYGTNSVRAVLVDVANGDELGTCVWDFETGQAGIIIDPSDHNLARQNPADYLKGAEIVTNKVLSQAKKADKDFDPNQVIGIG